jgi:hypothetical protein
MTVIPFALLFAAVVAAHFLFARSAWQRLRGAGEAAIDLNYVRRDNWLAQAFRHELREWTAAKPLETHSGFQLYQANRDRLIETRQTKPNSREHNHDLYSFQDDVQGPAGSVFLRELNAERNARFGAGCRLQAVTARGSLELGPKCEVKRWADADGEVVLGAETKVGSRVTSRYAIRVNAGAGAKLVSAPSITTEGFEVSYFDRAAVPARGAIQFPMITRDDSGGLPGPERSRLLLMEENGILHEGDLHFTLPVEIRCRLVVRGSFSCPAGSLIHHDIKAEGGIKIGGGSLVAGNLAAGGNLALFDGCRFEGVLHAGGDILLATGVRGVARKERVAAYAAGTAYLESNVAIEGKVAAGESVRMMPTAGR